MASSNKNYKYFSGHKVSENIMGEGKWYVRMRTKIYIKDFSGETNEKGHLKKHA
jgi:hypothetical protein